MGGSSFATEQDYDDCFFTLEQLVVDLTQLQCFSFVAVTLSLPVQLSSRALDKNNNTGATQSQSMSGKLKNHSF